MTLDGLEKIVVKELRRQSPNSKINIVRYADDFIVTGNSKELLENTVKPALTKFLAERGLVLSPEKTKITHIADGFDFLGWNVRKYNGKLLIKPSKANINAHLGKIREVIRRNPTAKQINLIHQLNPIIRGWSNYHSHVVSKVTFTNVDSHTWSALWRWAKRRHPQIGMRWIKERYFHVVDTKQWIFSAPEIKDDKVKMVTLRHTADTPIKRHVKIKGEANPYDKSWEPYFVKRWCGKLMKFVSGFRKVLRVWQGQDGKCSICYSPISKETPWVILHRVKRTEGGTEAMYNSTMVHCKCQGKKAIDRKK